MKEPADFSLVLGGPLYQLWRRTHLTGDAMDLLLRRVIVMTFLAWAPLLVFSIVEGHAWGGSIQLPFLKDVDMHARLLLALPLLIVAELAVHRRLSLLVRPFLERGIVPPHARQEFDSAVASAMRLRDSPAAEALLLLFVCIVGVRFVWRSHVALDVPSWYGTPVDGALQSTLAGWWLRLVSIPMFQFLLMRWYFRLFVWGRFLWQVSRIELNILPTHPDRRGGLGFLAFVGYAFSPLLLSQGTLLAGVMANHIFYEGATLPQFKEDIVGLMVVMAIALLGPLLVFSPKLAAARRVALREYGALAQLYVREFDHKWLRGGARAGEPLIGSADIQSLADLGNSYEVLRGMLPAPITLQTVLQLGLATLLPMAPLLLTMFSPEQLLERLLGIAF